MITLIAILLVLWIIGTIGGIGGGYVHLLLIVATILGIVEIIHRRRARKDNYNAHLY